jgi:ATP-dependent exoDNAse (exonuclease V) alpha subunit
MIITRANDRRLRLTPTDWVKNGDRWTITHVDRSGGLTVRHSRSQLKCQLPADYVTTSTGLGYATTIHSAQGVSADTMHGLVTGQESRPQLYTMLTRGRQARQPPLPSSRGRRRPPQPHPTRHDLTPDADRDAAADYRP